MICVHTTAATLSHHLPSLPLPPLLSNPIPPLTSLLTSPSLFPHHLSNYASLPIPSTSPHLPSTLTYIFSSSLQPTFFNPLPSHHPPPLSPPASPLTTHLPSHHPPPLSPPTSPLSSTVLLLIGNKLDLESEREVTEEEAVRYAKGIGANHLQCSAATGQGE